MDPAGNGTRDPIDGNTMKTAVQAEEPRVSYESVNTTSSFAMLCQV